jgi:hypothetical protein
MKGSGDPTWKPPNFYLEALKEQVDQGYFLVI